jgi:hypothetical protein
MSLKHTHSHTHTHTQTHTGPQVYADFGPAWLAGYIAFAMFPLLFIVYGLTPHFMRRFTVCTSVEHMRDNKAVQKVLRHMKTHKALKLISLVNMMRQWSRLQIVNDKTRMKEQQQVVAENVDPATIERFDQAFTLFDKDNSGSIESDELHSLLGMRMCVCV